MGKFLDLPGLRYFWNKIKSKIEDVIDSKLSDVNDSFISIRDEAAKSSSNATHAYNLIMEAFNTLTPPSSDILGSAVTIVRHEKAIEQIAKQLNSTYVSNSMEEEDEYTPGFIFKAVTAEEMQNLLNDNKTEDKVIYFVKEE